MSVETTGNEDIWKSPSGTFSLERVTAREIHLVGKGHRVAFEWGDYAYALFGELLSSANRPSAAEAELRAKVERLRHSLHDIQKPGALNHFASRWDQINGILGAAGIEPDPDNWVNDVHTLVTERDQLRAELERVRGPAAATYSVVAYDDSGYGDDCSKKFVNQDEALEYAKALDDRFRPVVTKHISILQPPSEVIYRRFAELPAKPPIEPIPGTAAELAKLTIRGGGNG